MACIARALAPAASFGAPTRSRRALRGLPVRSPSSSRDAADVRDAVSPRAFNPFAPPPDLSGDLLSAVAKFALETNLASHASVDAAVDAQVLGLLGGKVDGVVITGRDWRSRRDLTCRSLRFAVGEVSIDQGALLTDRLVKLRSVPTGDAVVEFTPEDFGNFLAHPLTKDAARASGPGGFEFVFDGGAGCEPSRAVTLENDAVVFGGSWMRQDAEGGRYRVEMRPSATEKGRVDVAATTAPNAATDGGRPLASAMAEFFEGLVIDLSGARVSYRDMEVREGTVTLSLALRVVSFPPPASFARL